MLTEQMNYKTRYLEDILNTISDGIYISDDQGITLWLNKASENICGRSKEKLINKTVYELEKEGVYNPSVTRLALESGTTVSTVQTMSDNRNFLVTGHLIRNELGQVELVIAHSRDITEVVRTTSQLEATERLLKRYSQEIRKMRSQQIHINQTENIIIGKSKAHQGLIELVDRIANVNTTVLITGETGVGKNVIAKRIHLQSERCDKPFLQINCGAIPDSLIESELFGYKKGAFTGASTSGKIGLVKMADGGTLFLDEIGDLPIHLQVKLLQLIQEKAYIPIGETKVHTTDIRIIAATNCDLLQMTNEGKFRADLFYRLNILPVHIPPLCERREDIFLLLSFYLQKYNQLYQQDRKFSSEVIDCMQNYNWPGNVRELENLVEHVVITAKSETITMHDLPSKFNTSILGDDNYLQLLNGGSLNEVLENLERKIIQKAFHTNKTTRETAKKLGITQSLLMRRLKKYDLNYKE